MDSPPAPSPWRAAVPAAVYTAIIGLSSIPSADPAVGRGGLEGPDWLSYPAHLVEYGLLGAALSWAAAGTRARRWVVVAVGMVLAGADETYQHLAVPGRSAQVRDLVVDGLALALGAWIAHRLADGR